MGEYEELNAMCHGSRLPIRAGDRVRLKDSELTGVVTQFDTERSVATVYWETTRTASPLVRDFLLERI